VLSTNVIVGFSEEMIESVEIGRPSKSPSRIC